VAGIAKIAIIAKIAAISGARCARFSRILKAEYNALSGKWTLILND